MNQTRQVPAPRCAFIQYTAEYSGSPISGLTVIDALREHSFEVDAIFSVGGPLEEEYQARGCGIHYLQHGQWLVGGNRLRRLRRWGREIIATLRFLKIFRHLRPQVVYVNTLMSVSAVMAARIYRIPVIWHVRETFEDIGGEMRWPLGGPAIVRFLVKRLPTEIIFVSDSVRKNIIGDAKPLKVQIMHNPLEERYFELKYDIDKAKQRMGLSASSFVVGVPGTLRPVKGHKFFLNAAVELARQDDDYKFIISGDLDTEYSSELRKLCKQLGIEDRVYFVGGLADMRDFYAACDIVCVPSCSEPFGRTVVEAFAQNRAVVATEVGGIPESVVDSKTGLLVAYGDVSALVACIQRLHVNSAFRKLLARNGRNAAKQNNCESKYKPLVLRIVMGSLRASGF